MATTPPPHLDPTDPIDRARLRAIERIDRYGFTKLIIGTGECEVPGCDCEPSPHPYTYTLGMHEHRSPDFVTFGLPMSLVSSVIDPVCEMAMDGEVLPTGRDHRLPLRRGPIVSFVEVPDRWVEHDPGRVGAWFDIFAPRFPTFTQVVWCDESGHMPWESACNPAVAAMQPILADDPISVPVPIE